MAEQVREQVGDLALVRESVWRFVRSRPGAEDPEDVVQEVMTRLLENRARLEPAAWEAYAVVSARNLLRDRDRDEGFWVDGGDGRRVWVQLVGAGESAVAVGVGDRVSFDGRAVPVPAGFAARAGITQAEGAAELERSGVLVEVPRERLRVR